MSIQVVDAAEPVACQCGSKEWHILGGQFPFVLCPACGTTGPNAETKMEAIRAWNKEYAAKPPGPASQAALDAVAHAVRVKLAAGGWKHGVDGMIVRLSKDQGVALLAELGMTQGEAK